MKELKLFGMRVKELRTIRKLSQEQACGESRYQPQIYEQDRNGTTIPFN